ncbi:MAG: glycosyltransferase family 2 protein [Candidatus Bathyarchaeia archaeon]
MSNISVIISTYSKERLHHLLDCIDSLKKQSLSPAEVILVLDPDPDLVEFYERKLSGIRVVVSQERGLSNARNTGVKNANGDIVTFIDDDAIADEKWLENLAKNYEDPKTMGVGGQIKPLWRKRIKWFPEELNWVIGCTYKGLPEKRADVRNPIGCNMSFRKEAFQKAGFFRCDIGRFGKKLLSGEEMEFSTRVLEKIPGSRIVYDPSAVVYHKVDDERISLRYLCKRSFYEGLSKALIAERKSSKVLSTEGQYVKHLFKSAIPSRLKRLYIVDSSLQILALLASSISVFSGFLTGRVMNFFSGLFEEY